jgi:hypothetical protein
VGKEIEDVSEVTKEVQALIDVVALLIDPEKLTVGKWEPQEYYISCKVRKELDGTITADYIEIMSPRKE